MSGEPMEEDPIEEVVGSCERCGGDVYEHSAYEIEGLLYDDQCAWYMQGGPDER